MANSMLQYSGRRHWTPKGVKMTIHVNVQSTIQTTWWPLCHKIRGRLAAQEANSLRGPEEGAPKGREGDAKGRRRA
jgi:hypothetical protein